MNNPNHPLYNALGGNSNIHLLDNMLFSTDQHKPSLIPQYAAYPMETLAAHQHAMNLAVSGQSHVAAAVAAVNNAATTIDTSLLYQQNDHHQQQPISYKIPQVSSVLIQQHHHQQQLQQQQQHHQQQQAIVSTINSLQEKKKDIVAQAMREEKIFEEISRAAESGHPKKTITSALSSNHSSSGSMSTPEPQQHQQQQQQQQQQQRQQQQHQAVAVKSEPAVLPSTSAGHSTPKMDDPKPGPSNASPGTSGGQTPKPSSANRPRPGGPGGVGGSGGPRPPIQRQQQIMPRLQLLEDEDDGLTCRMCLQPFWYKSELHDHLKSTHSITDPDRYEREEREKKIRRIREEQQRIAIAKQQRLGAAAAAVTKGFPSRPAAAPVANRGKGVTIGMNPRGGAAARPGRGGALAVGRTGHAGPRPSFQYRDGAFICDLCKKSFSDGNDMVAHWKSHVKQQQQQSKHGAGAGHAPERASKQAQPEPSKKGRGKSGGKAAERSKPVKTHTTSRGRPITSKQAGKKARQAAKKVKKGRSDKGKPRWTAYLVWSTRRRQEIKVEYPNYGFAEVGKLISEEWKQVPPDELEKYKEEAERMNATNVRKLPKINDSGDEDWSENDDPSFNEASKKPIMLKIKKEAPKGETRSGRKRKRPSFFQEFENEESNLDKILDDFEQEQLHETRTPKPKRAVKNPGSRPRQRRPPVQEEDYDDYDDEVELETTRSGRVRKKTKVTVFNYPDEAEQESENDEDRGDEYRPESDMEEPDEDFDEGVPEKHPAASATGKTSRKKSITLPPKKRGHGEKAGMSKADIEKATAEALAAKPVVIGLEKIKKKLTQTEEERAASKPSWLVDEEDIDDDKTDEPSANDVTGGQDHGADDVTLNTPNPASNPDDEDMDDVVIGRNGGNNELEGSVTEDDPPENMFGDDDDEEVGEPSKSEGEALPEDVEESGAVEGNQDDEHAQEFQSQDEQVEDHQQQEQGVGGGLDDPFTSNAGATNDDDLLTSAADTNSMEAGDDQYKNLIAESHMDDIFN